VVCFRYLNWVSSPGGQCTELYPDKPIYDIPAVPVCTGEELTQAILQQIEPFGAGMHLGEEVRVVQRQDDDSFLVETSAGTQFSSRAVVIAGGVGSFQPRMLRLANAEDFRNKSLHYHVRDPAQFAGKKLIVLGGGDSALDWALELVDSADRVTVVHEIKGEGDQISSVVIQPKEGDAIEVTADHVLVFFGLAPKLGPIAEWGLDINRKTINVDTEKFLTSEPGIYAVGDINHYPGKKKLILCGFHEAALAAFAIKQQLEPDKKVHVQYTTTSPVMHERLGLQDEQE